MELIVISNSSGFKGEAELINRLFEAGLGVFHLRKPGLNRVSYKKLIREIDAAYHGRLAIHQFHELREDYEISRLHFTEQHRRTDGKGLFLNSSFICSTSIHNLSEFEALNGFSYAFHGPLFDSLSKPSYRSTVESGFKWKARPGHPKLIALGGIDAINLLHVRQMGFDGAAVLGALWNDSPNVLDKFKKLQQLWAQTDLM